MTLMKYTGALNFKTNYSKEEIDEMIKSLRMGTEEWVRKGGRINVAKGCANNCVYCYARANSHRFNQRNFKDWAEVSICYGKRIPKKIKHIAGKYDFMMQTATDIPESEEGWKEWLRVAKDILNKKFSLLITTKPRLERIKMIHEELEDFKEYFTFRFSITSRNEERVKLFEPNASSYAERIESLKYVFDRKYNSSVSIEPLLDLSPIPIVEDIQNYLGKIDAAMDIGTIWIGFLKTKYIPDFYRKTSEELNTAIGRFTWKQSFENVLKWYKVAFPHERVVFKESVKKMMLKNNILIR